MKAFSQGCPPNFDFEQGNFSTWECFTGSTETINGKNYINLAPSAPTPTRHEIISSDSTYAKDPYGGFPMNCPYGGKYSVKLGNTQTGRGAEGIAYTFTVPPQEDTFTITYFYAVVFEDPGHPLPEQPRFFVTAYDVLSGEIINCASYDYVATSGIPGFKRSKLNSMVLYKDWSPASIQFINKENRQVRLEFKNADCTQGGHFGYAYLDVGTGCSNILATAPYCRETNSVILNAPYGFQSYIWWDEKYENVIGNGQALTLSPPPDTSGLFRVDLIPYAGFGCRDTAFAVVKPLPVPEMPLADSPMVFCQNTYFPELKATVTRGNELLWYTAASGGIYSYDPPQVPTGRPDTLYYYCSQKVMFGCESPRKKLMAIVARTPVPSFSINNALQCENVNDFIFTNTSTNLSNSTYTWDFGELTPVEKTQNAAHAYKKYGNYNVKLSVDNDGGCSRDYIRTVTLQPRPIANFAYPNIICENQAGTAFTDRSTVLTYYSFINKWWWNIDGTISTIQNPVATLTRSGKVPVRLAVGSSDGCLSDTIQMNLDIHIQPKADFGLDNSLFCNNEFAKFNSTSFIPNAPSTEYVSKWYWQFDNTPINGNLNPNPQQLFAQGVHKGQLVAESNFGCKSLPTEKSFEIFPKPNLDLAINDSCVFQTIRYTASDRLQLADTWYWNFGNGFAKGPSVVTKSFNKEGQNDFVLMGKTIHGCADTLVRPFTIFDNKAKAGNDTLVAIGQPVQLNARGGPNNFYTWSPATGLDNAAIETPIATWHSDQLYTMDAITDKGCKTQSKILIKRFKGPDLYIPTAFTPNADRKNDVLKVFPIGIKSFISFAVYNRYGEQVFFTTDYSKGWDGRIKSMPAQPGNYVAVAKAIDYQSKAMMRSVNVVLIQ
ncbi:MAG TPA: PKD domain-containing protein [Phnomibacter sp.]|nr:PKD domain-containing protein [Phnomibacter sp.]